MEMCSNSRAACPGDSSPELQCEEEGKVLAEARQEGRTQMLADDHMYCQGARIFVLNFGEALEALGWE